VRVTIDPITRLEGHGRVDLFLDELGCLVDSRLVVPEIRGFEKFLEGRPVEELPRITPRICGVCPEAHHAASAKAADAVYGVTLTETAEIIRRLQYNAFVAGDHATHFFALGGPDFIVGPDAPPAERNILGVIRKVGLETGKKVLRMRAEAHEVAEMLGGRRIHPVGMIPGGVSKGVSAEMQDRFQEIGDFMVEFSTISSMAFWPNSCPCSRSRCSSSFCRMSALNSSSVSKSLNALANSSSMESTSFSLTLFTFTSKVISLPA
jgi:F420-non-reducing hydrogenase large subunit